MSRSRLRLALCVLIPIGGLALLNPGYSAVYVDGPGGVIKTERWTFGPNSLFVFTRVAADEQTVQIEQQ